MFGVTGSGESESINMHKWLPQCVRHLSLIKDGETLEMEFIGIFDLLKNPFDIPFSLSVLFNKDVLPYCWLVALESFFNIAGYRKSETKTMEIFQQFQNSE